MYEEDFARRLTQLRIKKGVSARDMSLSIGQNPGYINTIENGKAFPTMTNFFYICEFLSITPQDFFDTETTNPEKLHTLIQYLKHLDDIQLESLTVIAEGLVARKEETVCKTAHSDM